MSSRSTSSSTAAARAPRCSKEPETFGDAADRRAIVAASGLSPDDLDPLDRAALRSTGVWTELIVVVRRADARSSGSRLPVAARCPGAATAGATCPASPAPLYAGVDPARLARPQFLPRNDRRLSREDPATGSAAGPCALPRGNRRPRANDRAGRRDGRPSIMDTAVEATTSASPATSTSFRPAPSTFPNAAVNANAPHAGRRSRASCRRLTGDARGDAVAAERRFPDPPKTLAVSSTHISAPNSGGFTTVPVSATRLNRYVTASTQTRVLRYLETDGGNRGTRVHERYEGVAGGARRQLRGRARARSSACSDPTARARPPRPRSSRATAHAAPASVARARPRPGAGERALRERVGIVLQEAGVQAELTVASCRDVRALLPAAPRRSTS